MMKDIELLGVFLQSFASACLRCDHKALFIPAALRQDLLP
jgi:hypothetical protein